LRKYVSYVRKRHSRNHSIEGHNPGYNVKNTLSSLDKEITNLSCYAEVQYKCFPRTNTPLTPLRAITTEEGGQVSNINNNNNNEINHHHDRDLAASSGDQRQKNALPEPSKGVQLLNGPGNSVEAEFPRHIWDPGKSNNVCSFYILLLINPEISSHI
jgi:hypothetical protein